jgi:hypothetical protein
VIATAVEVHIKDSVSDMDIEWGRSTLSGVSLTSLTPGRYLCAIPEYDWKQRQ